MILQESQFRGIKHLDATSNILCYLRQLDSSIANKLSKSVIQYLELNISSELYSYIVRRLDENVITTLKAKQFENLPNLQLL